ncbi:MAG: NAD(P)/FAD-dependent oxidoreductase [Lachnospiraceae bacterium]|nr:NAD(P)/FAD-dependent oxidoreductase [Lachnospiraceae bacterium]
MFDVIVIGAGPTGSTASKILVEKGYRVLLIEKFRMPRYKSCSGQLIKKSVDLVQAYFGEAVPISTMCAPTENRGMIFNDDKGKAFRFEQSGFNVWRSSFDKWLADKAAQAGAEVRDGTSAIFCEERDGVVTVTLKAKHTYTEQARYVIDCEGVVGTLKRKLLDRKQQYITTYQTYNQGSIDLDYHFFHAYLQPELSEYDAWFNVKDNQLVLGVSVKDSSKAVYYYAHFTAYMKEKHGLQIDRQLRVDRWLMPHIRPGCKIDYGVGRIFFAGEIAGFLNPMGEGISAGMESGYCAAAAIAQHFDSPDMIYADYKDSTAALHNYMKRQWSLVGGMAETFHEMKL